MFPQTFEEAGRAWVHLAGALGDAQKVARVPSIVIAAAFYGPHGVLGGEVVVYPPPLADPKDDKTRGAKMALDAALVAFLEEKCAHLRRQGVREHGAVFDEGVDESRRGYRDQRSFGSVMRRST